jgi:hypothetical protein
LIVTLSSWNLDYLPKPFEAADFDAVIDRRGRQDPDPSRRMMV